ncbi:D-arabinose 5-phosphate isomerase, partial [Xanthomonas sp. Kuri4-3]
MAVSPLSPAATDDASLVASGRRVVEIEQGALAAMAARIGTEFA